MNEPKDAIESIRQDLGIMQLRMGRILSMLPEEKVCRWKRDPQNPHLRIKSCGLERTTEYPTHCEWCGGRIEEEKHKMI